jgi:hypothetical protein
LGEQRHLNHIFARVPFEITELLGEFLIERDRLVCAGYREIDVVGKTSVLPHVVELVGFALFRHSHPLLPSKRLADCQSKRCFERRGQEIETELFRTGF